MRAHAHEQVARYDTVNLSACAVIDNTNSKTFFSASLISCATIAMHAVCTLLPRHAFHNVAGEDGPA